MELMEYLAKETGLELESLKACALLDRERMSDAEKDCVRKESMGWASKSRLSPLYSKLRIVQKMNDSGALIQPYRAVVSLEPALG
tara:strand:+ start:892 stop:1146 length:255 start_codon:yes stop_codon:yes gene_type:complete